MDNFSFYLSYYGLILGLSVAQVATGFLNAIDARHRIKIGWLTPALGVFIFLDITSFWLFAWAIRSTLTISWGSMYLGLLIAILYFIASGLVFPRNIDEWPDLDVHYWRHKRWIVAGLLVPNLISFTQATLMHVPTINAAYVFAQATYWPEIFLLLATKRKWQDLTLLSILIGGYVTNAFIPNWAV